ncbi:hypothetical protein TNCV_2031991 [Trichonephila clavipes]|nr:hypothetical protein TNCV_2031991 [Trichonephila clavipes]
MKRICQSDSYNEESVKCLLEGILEEIRERENRQFEEHRLAREFELERLRALLRDKLKEREFNMNTKDKRNYLANVCYLSGNRTVEVS